MKKLDFANISSEEILSGDYGLDEVSAWQMHREIRENEAAAEAKKKSEEERNDPFKIVIKKYERSR